MPAWFVQQFQETRLAQALGGLPAVFYFLAVLETIGFLGCVASVVRLEFLRPSKTILRWTLVFALLVFVVLAYGARLTGKFDVAAYNLMYFAGALLASAKILLRLPRFRDAQNLCASCAFLCSCVPGLSARRLRKRESSGAGKN